MHRWLRAAPLVALVSLTPQVIEARPNAPALFCDTYPDAPICDGFEPACSYCHQGGPPAVNPFGADVRTEIVALGGTALDVTAFETHLGDALLALESRDSDGDGAINVEEITAASEPGDAASVPSADTCPAEGEDPGYGYALCEYDARFAYVRVAVDFCGERPSFQELEALEALDGDGRRAAIHDKLDACLRTEFWRGYDGVLWSLAHPKVRPVPALIGFADFHADYDLFAYAHVDGNDVRALLTADFHVERAEVVGEGGAPFTTYTAIDERQGQPLAADRRCGMITTAWFLFYNTMFSAIPRGTAAQAYRSYLGLDIARSEGLEWGVSGEPLDYDGAGVDAEGCRDCHATLDPLSYPFSRYQGLTGAPYTYEPWRMLGFAFLGEAVVDTPEAGVLFGEPVEDLRAWAALAADSDPFFQTVTADFFRLLVGREPEPGAPGWEEFVSLSESLADDPAHSVDAMLHRLVETEAYGAP